MIIDNETSPSIEDEDQFKKTKELRGFGIIIKNNIAEKGSTIMKRLSF